MARRYVGDAVVEIWYHGTAPSGGEEYRGRITTGKRGVYWDFDELFAPKFGFGVDVYGDRLAYDSAKAYDEMAAAACDFGSYFTTHNRGEDVPEWAPSAEVADAIDHAISIARGDPGGTLSVQRARNGKVVMGLDYERLHRCSFCKDEKTGRCPGCDQREWCDRGCKSCKGQKKKGRKHA